MKVGSVRNPIRPELEHVMRLYDNGRYISGPMSPYFSRRGDGKLSLGQVRSVTDGVAGLARVLVAYPELKEDVLDACYPDLKTMLEECIDGRRVLQPGEGMTPLHERVIAVPDLHSTIKTAEYMQVPAPILSGALYALAERMIRSVTGPSAPPLGDFVFEELPDPQRSSS